MRASPGRAGCHSRRPSTVSVASSGRRMARQQGAQPVEPRGRYEIEESGGRDAVAGGEIDLVPARRARSSRARARASCRFRLDQHVLAACSLQRHPRASRPARDFSGLRRQQRRIVVYQQPVLIAADQRRQRHEVGAAAGGEIDDAPRRAAGARERRAEAAGKVAAPRRRIEGLAPSQPARDRIRSRGEPIQRGGPMPVLPSASRAAPWRQAPLSAARRARRRSSANNVPQRFPQRRGVSRRHEYRCGRRNRVGDGAGGGRDYGQAVRQRFGVDHAVTFVIGGQHEKIGVPIRGGQKLRRTFPDQRNPVAESLRRDRAAQRRGGSGVALEAAYAREPPVVIAQIPPALPRAAGVPCAALSFRRRAAAAVPAACASPVDAGLSVPGIATTTRCAATPEATTACAVLALGQSMPAQQRPEPRLERRVVPGFGRVQSGLERQRMMDETDQTQALRLRTPGNRRIPAAPGHRLRRSRPRADRPARLPPTRGQRHPRRDSGRQAR